MHRCASQPHSLVANDQSHCMDVRVFSRAELLQLGHTRTSISNSLADGEIVRARRDCYVDASAPTELMQAVRVGGRLTCVSLLALFGVFVLEHSNLHVHAVRGSSRQRSPESRRIPLASARARSIRLHWATLCMPVSQADAQPARAAVATLDSALNQKLIHASELANVFALLPAKYGVLRPLVDGRAESGPETLMRLLLRPLGCEVQLQVTFAGVGRVDLLVDGWLVIECDSERHPAKRDPAKHGPADPSRGRPWSSTTPAGAAPSCRRRYPACGRQPRPRGRRWWPGCGQARPGRRAVRGRGCARARTRQRQPRRGPS